MDSSGALANEQLLADLSIRSSGRNQSEHLDFPCSEVVCHRVVRQHRLQHLAWPATERQACPRRQPIDRHAQRRTIDRRGEVSSPRQEHGCLLS